MGRETFINNLSSIGVELTDRQLNQFDKYYELLVEWNKVMNLTGITDYDEVLLKHYVDSIVLKLPIEGQKNSDEGQKSNNDRVKADHIKLIDVGTGAGFPGLPLKIANPSIEVVLLDSLNKRINFLNEVIATLGLQNITTIHSRAEDGGRNKLYREKFDVSVSRAVANLSTLAEYNMPFVKIGGYFVAYKSGDIEEELKQASNAVNMLGGKVEKVDKFTLPNSDIDRSLVYIKKVKPTPMKYPRKSGLPGKEPL